MVNALVGSVTAELLLNTEQFDSSIKRVQAEVRNLNTSFRGTDAQKMAEDITRLEEQLQKCTDVIKAQDEVIEQLRAGYKKLDEESLKVAKNSSKIATENEKLVQSEEKVASATEKATSSIKKFNLSYANLGKTSGNNFGTQLTAYMNKLLNFMNKDLRGDSARVIKDWSWGTVGLTKNLENSLSSTMAKLKSFQEALNQFGGMSAVIKRYNDAVASSETKTKEFQAQFTRFSPLFSEVQSNLDSFVNKYKLVMNEMASQRGIIENAQKVNETLAQMGSTVVTQFDRMKMAVNETTAGFPKLTEASRTTFIQINNDARKGMVALAEFHRQVKGSADVTNNLKEIIAQSQRVNEVLAQMGSQYVSAFDKLKIALKECVTGFPQLTEASRTSFISITQDAQKGAEAVARFHAEINRKSNLSATISELSAVARRGSEAVNQMSSTYVTAFDRMSESINKVTTGFPKLEESSRTAFNSVIQNSRKAVEVLSANESLYASKIERLKLLLNQVSQATITPINPTRQLGTAIHSNASYITQFGNATTQTSSKMSALSGVTAKLKGALSSLKMVLTTLSSLFIWTFGMSLYEATKQTTQSKNEMESYLHQMGMGRGSINLFNQGLDETADKFKKLNKYMIGETIAGIGMEFDLTANQMKKAMDVVAMIQNEYVRAGRKEEEATLAVKDILQGEFLRLSRETGVGKNELIDTGLWSGDLKDVEGLMEALRKVGTDRHWDLFASKCNSLNDVISETKNRISEFGASLVDQLSPAIVSGFNMIVGIIDKVTSTWNNFNPFQKIAVGLPIIFALGTAIMMVAGKLSLLDIATMGYTKSLATTILRLDVATVKEFGLATAITSKVTSLEASTVAEMGSVTALMTRALGLDTNIAKEFGLTTALAYSTFAKNVDTASMDANSIAKEFNAMTNLNLIQTLAYLVTGEEATTVATWSSTEAFWALIASLTALEALAIVGFIATLGIALGSLWMEAERAKEAVDGFYDIVDNGDSYLEDAQKNVEALEKQYQNLGDAISEAQAKGEDTWKLEQNQAIVGKNLEVAKSNLTDIQNVNDNAKKSAEEFNNQITMANTDFERKNAEIFKKLGKGEAEATEQASHYVQQYLKGMEQMRTSTNAYVHALDDGSKHIDDQVDVLKEAGASSDELVQYAQDYGEEVLKNAQYQKEWAEGDFWAIFKIGLSDLKLAWIDFTYWIGQQQWWKDFCNAMGEMQNALGDLYNALKPVLPVLWEIGKAIISAEWNHLVTIAYGVYEVMKILYPVLREIAGVKYEEIKDLVGHLYDLSDWVSKNGKKVEDWFKQFSEKDDMGKAEDIVSMIWNIGSHGGLGGYVLSNLDGMELNWDTILDMLLPKKGLSITNIIEGFDIDWNGLGNGLFQMMIDGLANHSFGNEVLFVDAIGEFISNTLKTYFDFERISQAFKDTFGDFNLSQAIIDAIFNNDGSDTSNGTGVAKSIPEDNLINQVIHGLVGDDPVGAMTSAVDMYIVQPFGMALQLGLANIPIVGDILMLLGLIDSTTPTAQQKGDSLAQIFGWAVENKIRSIPIIGDILAFLGVIDSTYPTANSKGYGVGHNVHDGVDRGKQGTADLIRDEMNELIGYLTQCAINAWGIAQQIGSNILNGINSVIQHNSPGIPALLIADEMVEIQNSMANAEADIYAQAQNIGFAITNGIQPNTDINFDAEAMAQYQADMVMAMGMAGETVDTSESAFSQLDYSTATTFANIGTTIGTTMLNIANTTKTNYSNIAVTTKSQLENMQSQTTKNIGAIRNSWTQMQVALINSAEHIRSETGAKIQSLQNNMASFWRKVQNPALLLGAGEPSEQKRVSKPRRYSSGGSGVRKILQPKGYAGAGATRTPTGNFTSQLPSMRGSPLKWNPNGGNPNTLDQLKAMLTAFFKDTKYKGKQWTFDGVLADYLYCLLGGGDCVAGKGYAGGWDFDWADDIKQALLTWHTHFGDIYDPYLYVGKFENDDFPIRGIAPIALNYIQDAIGRTSYEFYYDSKYGDPLSIWNAGHFNCYDGAILVMALARALGFPNSHMVHGSWNGIAHVWAFVEGLGNIDATAIQGGYGLTAPSRTGVAGSPSLQKRFKHNRMPSSDNESGNVFHGDINIHIDGTGKDTEEIGREVRNVMVDLMSPNPTTGI